jgi:hypothetical protein
MTSRERVFLALNHREPDRVPLDLGSTGVTGMHVIAVYKLRQALELDKPGTPVKVIEPYQMLGEITPDLVEALGVDVLSISGKKNMFGFENKEWKSWIMFDGTPVLVPGSFNTEPDAKGEIFMYPEGDQSVPPSAVMPQGGFFFNAIDRQPSFREEELRVEDNCEEFGKVTKTELQHYKEQTEHLYKTTDKALMANIGGMAFGDIAFIPAMQLKHPKGIRNVEEWYMSSMIRPAFVRGIFEKQCEFALDNLEKYAPTLGNRPCAVFITGTDFGAQHGPFISPVVYRDLFKPFHRLINEWIHAHTTWKTFIHSCGSVREFIPEFIDAGFDILNPVQTSAAEMDPVKLKRDFGRDIVFWGGGIDTQRILPFGTPDEVRRDVQEKIRILGKGGGFVFNTIHNVQGNVPVENVVALYEAFMEYSSY